MPKTKPEGGLDVPSGRDDAQDAYLVELGQRVRRMRALRGMSRKTLAQTSGVSERYIAQLESGLGNISIILLRRVAAAIGAPLENLVAEGGDRPDDWPLVRDMLRDAPRATLDAVRSLLQGGDPRSGIGRQRIALIGLRGAGKSTLGQRAAQELGWPFVELGKEIERDTGLSMTEIFSLYGQDGFRRLELACLRKVIERPGSLILATAGGIVAEPVTFQMLRDAFFTIWIKAKPADHMGRVRQQGDLRPMGNDSAAMAELITILSSREPLYARAQRVLDTTGRSVEQSVETLVGVIKAAQEAP